MPHVRRRMLVTLDAPAAAVRDAAASAFSAEPDADGTLLLPAPHVPEGAIEVRVLDVAAGGSVVEIEGHSAFSLPFFGWALRPLVRAQLRGVLRMGVATGRAAALGEASPPSPSPVFCLPSAAFDRRQSALLATASAATAIAMFGGALYGQFADFIADSYGATDATLGLALAFTRVGVLVSLFATALSDRIGRRRLILVGVAGACITNGLAAAAPTFEVFTALQVLNRGFINTTAVVAAIAAVEEAPEGARAFAAAMLGLAGGFGYSFAVLALPFGDVSSESWRLAFALSGLSLVFLPRIARHLVEGHRFGALVDAGVARGRIREVFNRTYGRRFVLLGLVAFLANIFNSPSAQLTNRFLADERGFSGFDITVFRAVTSGLPGLFGVLLAGRLAESRGRRPLAAVAMVIATSTQMVFFLGRGPGVWVAATVSVVASACSGLALATLGTELFPTEVRGTSNAFLLVVGVSGSATGLVIAGVLSDPVGGLGPAIALCGIGSLIAAVFLVPLLPESKARRLDEISPSHIVAPPGPPI